MLTATGLAKIGCGSYEHMFMAPNTQTHAHSIHTHGHTHGQTPKNQEMPLLIDYNNNINNNNQTV